MDLFEFLFIALFILFPVMEGILKQRRKGQQKGSPGTDPSGRSDRSGADAGGSEPAEAPRSAADMVPEDLWELMTGQQRPQGESEAEAAGAPWSMEPESSSGQTAPEPEEEWHSDRWAADDEAEAPEPVSAGYEGPEAYSLETPAPEPIERTVPSAQARHRAFHELIDRPKAKRKNRVSPLMRSLGSPDGLRQAVLLKEILGPPKGLE